MPPKRAAVCPACPTWISDDFGSHGRAEIVRERATALAFGGGRSPFSGYVARSMSTGAELHAACEPLAPLVGTWRGPGEGHYPTIDDFAYLEELTFSHVGKPFLAMTQRTRDPHSDAPLHAEVGYLRPQPHGAIELVLTQPTGVVEIHSGSLREEEGALVVDLRTERVEGTRTAKPISEVRRRIEVRGDMLVSEMWMAAMGQPLTHHLRAELTRA